MTSQECAGAPDTESRAATLAAETEQEWTLDRINNDGAFEPENVRWATLPLVYAPAASEAPEMARRTAAVMSAAQLIAALQHCPPDAGVFFSDGVAEDDLAPTRVPVDRVGVVYLPPARDGAPGDVVSYVRLDGQLGAASEAQ
jgi:hypothetical protein